MISTILKYIILNFCIISDNKECKYINIDNASSEIKSEIIAFDNNSNIITDQKLNKYKLNINNSLLLYKHQRNHSSLYVELNLEENEIRSAVYYHNKFMSRLQPDVLKCLNDFLHQNLIDIKLNNSVLVYSSNDRHRQYITFSKLEKVIGILIIENSDFKGIVRF